MDKGEFLDRADACRPNLRHWRVSPVALVKPIKDSAAFQGWRMEKAGEVAGIGGKLMGRGDGFVLDFGEHVVGQLRLSLSPEPASDAPTRLKLTFGEVPAEIAESFEPFDYSKGALSRSWLQDEVINIDLLPQTLTLPRRYAFRYVKIEIIDTAPAYKVRFGEITCEAVSSADANAVEALPSSMPADLRTIDEVSLRTLRNCMQTVFEDGPKRDRRLWLGDLRLQALANYVSFRNFDLIKRCLFLFAGLMQEDGLVNADMYEFPEPHRGNCRILDYSALFAPTVLDYLEASEDRPTALALWPVARKQLDLLQFLNGEGLFVDPGNWWLFIDWSGPLHKSAAIHGVLLYSLQETWRLAKRLGKEAEVAELPARIEQMKAAARKYLWDEKQKCFVSGPQKQVSWATQAWMILGGVVEGDEAAALLERVVKDPAAVRPAGPYLYHHVVHAMLLVGMREQAIALVRGYWGAMVDLGATTFWEVFDPEQQKLSPYHNHLMNSYCHAWSCTPTWFLRRWIYPQK